MSKQRIVKDEIWDDEWFYDLDPSEKLVWLFLLTNPRTNIAGIYKINFKWMSQMTGLDREIVRTIITRFVVDGKIIYDNDWIGLVNFHKHLYRKNPSIALGIKRLRDEMTDCPQSVAFLWHTLLNSTLLNSSESDDSQSKKKLNNKDMGWKAYNENSHSDELPAVDMDSREVIKPKEKEKRHYKEVYELFYKILHTPPLNRADWVRNTTEQKSADDLYTIKGMEQIEKALELYEEHKDDEYCPSINSPSSLMRKWDKLKEFKQKNGL